MGYFSYQILIGVPLEPFLHSLPLAIIFHFLLISPIHRIIHSVVIIFSFILPLYLIYLKSLLVSRFINWLLFPIEINAFSIYALLLLSYFRYMLQHLRCRFFHANIFSWSSQPKIPVKKPYHVSFYILPHGRIWYASIAH